MNIKTFTKEYLDFAVDLFIKKYQNSVKHNPLLPRKYLNREVVRPSIEWLVDHFPGVVALDENNLLIGYIIGIYIENFKSSHNGYFVPEHGHAVVDDNNEVFEELYLEIIKIWVENKASVFAFTILNEEKNISKSLNYSGHGILVSDGIRKAEPMKNCNEQVEIRIATIDDIDSMIPLYMEHIKYMQSANTFLFIGDENEDDAKRELTDWITNSNVFIALNGQEIIGMMRCEIGGGDSSMIIQAEHIVKVMGTHVKANYQNQGIAKALLNQVNVYALNNHCDTLAVDFETANYKARRFWLKHFIAPSYSLIRYINDRIIT